MLRWDNGLNSEMLRCVAGGVVGCFVKKEWERAREGSYYIEINELTSLAKIRYRRDLTVGRYF